MTEGIDNMILEHLEALRVEVAAIETDMDEIKECLCCHEASVIELRRASSHAVEVRSRQQVTIDGLAKRIERIEKRLDLS